MNLQNFDPITLMKAGFTPKHEWCIHVRLPTSWWTKKNEKIIVDRTNLIKMIEDLEELMPAHSPRLIRASVFQLEKGDNGNLHYQITLFLTKKIYLSDIRKRWKMGSDTSKKFYLKEAEDPLKSMLYCSKTKTRVLGPFYTYDGENS